jgi:hypothetical protein
VTRAKQAKRRKVLNALNKIENLGGVYIRDGGKHLKIVAIKEGAGSFALPVSHPEVSSYILKGLIKWMKYRHNRHFWDIKLLYYGCT